LPKINDIFSSISKLRNTPSSKIPFHYTYLGRPSHAYLTTICRDHLGKVTHAWIDVAASADLLWAEAKVGILAISSANSIHFDCFIFFKEMPLMELIQFRIRLSLLTGRIFLLLLILTH
jgi:hypothetical protein